MSPAAPSGQGRLHPPCAASRDQSQLRPTSRTSDTTTCMPVSGRNRPEVSPGSVSVDDQRVFAVARRSTDHRGAPAAAWPCSRRAAGRLATTGFCHGRCRLPHVAVGEVDDDQLVGPGRTGRRPPTLWSRLIATSHLRCVWAVDSECGGSRVPKRKSFARQLWEDRQRKKRGKRRLEQARAAWTGIV